MAILDISPRANIYNEAHESSEILCGMGEINKLQIYVASHEVEVNLAKYSPHQIGNICGFTAAVSAGYTRKEIFELIAINRDYETTNILNKLDLV